MQAIAQINAVNGTALRILPPGLTPPVMIRFNPATVPIVQMILGSKTLSEAQIFDYTLNFVRVKLFTVPGLQTPAPFGGKLRQIQVDLNPTLMESKGVSPNDVVNALVTSNLLIPAGTARLGDIDYNVMMNSSPPTVDLFNQMPIKVVNSVPVLIGDVAKVRDSFAVQNNIVHVHGRRATYLQHPESRGRVQPDRGRLGPRTVGGDPRRAARRPRGAGHQSRLRPVGVRARRDQATSRPRRSSRRCSCP